MVSSLYIRYQLECIFTVRASFIFSLFLMRARLNTCNLFRSSLLSHQCSGKYNKSFSLSYTLLSMRLSNSCIFRVYLSFYSITHGDVFVRYNHRQHHFSISKHERKLLKLSHIHRSRSDTLIALLVVAGWTTLEVEFKV